MRYLLAVLLLAGCTTYQPQPIGPEFNEDTPRTITAGVTTRDEIRQRFGTPPTVFNHDAQILKGPKGTTVFPANEAWTYTRTLGSWSSATLRIVFTNDVVERVSFERITQ